MTATSRHLLAAVIGLASTCLVIVLAAAGWLVGPAALIAAILAWVLVPTARRLTSRIALNGALVMGFAPILFWGPSMRVGNVGVVALLLALAAGLVVAMLVWAPASRRLVLPRVDEYWWLPVATALFSAWYFWPFLRARAGSASLAMLVQAFGGDNVAHFDMFAMIRSHAVSGLGWGTPADGSSFAYTTYPQHFHALAAMGAELWSGAPRPGEDGPGLYMFGTALVLAVGLITLTAAFASSRLLRRVPGLPAVPVAATVSVFFLGAGVSNLSFGFPGFVLALLGSLIAIVIASSHRRPSLVDVAAVGGMLVLVANCWILLAPLAGIPFVLVVFRLRWRAVLRHRAGFVVAVGTCLVVVAACIYTVVLVLAATSSAGSPEAALGTPGGVAPLPVPVGISLGLAIIGLGFAAAGAARGGAVPLWRHWRSPYALWMLVTVVALVVAGGLTALQLLRAHFISYFQYKLFNGLIVVFAVLLVFAVSVSVAEVVSRHPVRVRKATVVTSVALLCAALVTLSGLPTGGKKALVGQAFASDTFRSGLESGAASPAPGIPRLASASRLMESAPCEVPFYLAAAQGDPGRGEASQWAMSLSGNWTARASTIMNYFFAHDVTTPSDPSQELAVLLGRDDARCAIVAPSVRSTLSASVLADYGDRILTW